jgi:hypothetical protein
MDHWLVIGESRQTLRLPVAGDTKPVRQIACTDLSRNYEGPEAHLTQQYIERVHTVLLDLKGTYALAQRPARSRLKREFHAFTRYHQQTCRTAL